MSWDWQSKTKGRVDVVGGNVKDMGKKANGKYAAGHSPFEKLPTELLGTLYPSFLNFWYSTYFLSAFQLKEIEISDQERLATWIT